MKIKLNFKNRTAILFNAAAILIAGASVGVVVRSALFETTVPPCSERYVHGTRLALDRDGVPMTAADLQVRVANSDWGLARGARVVKLKSGPAKHAIEFDLASAPPVGTPQRDDGRAGLGFTWTPQGMGQPRAACLAYSVFIPEGFVFGKGGRLPGLMGTLPGGETEQTVFSTRYTWNPEGEADVYAHLPGWPEGRTLGNERRGFAFPRARWISLEQEVMLNTPGKKDGLLRVWLDGELVYQKKNVLYRAMASVPISGVLAEAVAGQPTQTGRPKTSQKVWISPFEVRWPQLSAAEAEKDPAKEKQD
jgi:hypothetical protein